MISQNRNFILNIMTATAHPVDTTGLWRPSIQLGTEFHWCLSISISSACRASSWGWLLFLPVYQLPGRGMCWVGHWIALGHLTYAPVKKTDFFFFFKSLLLLLRTVEAFSILMWQTSAAMLRWDDDSRCLLYQSHTTSAQKVQFNKSTWQNFDLKFIVICIYSIWESTGFRPALHYITQD